MKKFLLLFILTYLQAFSQSTGLLQDTAVFNGKFNNRPFAVTDRLGRLHLCYTSQTANVQQSREIFYAVEDADSFRTLAITRNSSDDNYPTISTDVNNFIHMAFEQKDEAGNFQVKYTNNVKGYFIPPVSITRGGMNKATPYSTVGPDSLVHFVYYTYTSGSDSIYYRNYNYRSGHLSPEHALAAAEATGDYEASIAVDARGIIHIVLKGGQDEAGRLRYFRGIRNLIREAYTGVTGSVESPRIHIDNGNVVYIAYRLKEDQALYMIDNSRGRFSLPLRITPAGHRPCMFSNFASDYAGHIYILYYNPALGSGRGYYLVHGSAGSFSDTLGICHLPGEYIIRNTASCAAKGNGQIALFYSSSAVRSINGVRQNEVESGIFFKRGTLSPKPEIYLKKDSIDFGGVYIDTEGKNIIPIKNRGTAPLKLFSPFLSSPAFGIRQFDTLYIKPDSSVNLELFFSPSDTTLFEGYFNFSTNIYSNHSLKVYLRGRGLGAGEASLERDTLFFNLDGAWRDSILLRNTGTAMLRVDSLSFGKKNGYSLIHSPLGFSLKPDSSRCIFFVLPEDEAKNSINDSLFIYFDGGNRKGFRKIMIKGERLLKGNKRELNESELEGKIKYRLDQNYPNPFNPQTIISFTIPHRAMVSLKVYDELAREIATLVDEFLEEGTHSVTFQAGDISTGVYYYKLFVQGDRRGIPDFIEVKKMLFMK